MDRQAIFNVVMLVLIITCYVYIYVSNKACGKLINDIVNEQLRHNKVMGDQLTKIILDVNNKKGKK